MLEPGPYPYETYIVPETFRTHAKTWEEVQYFCDGAAVPYEWLWVLLGH